MIEMSNFHRFGSACVLAVVLHFSTWAPISGQVAQDTVPVLIRARWLFDSKRGVMLGGHDILVRGGAIETIGENLVAPRGTHLIDLRCCAVLPGLIDAHTHLLMEHPGDQDPGQLGLSMIAREGDVLRALRGASRARSYLEAGFTTVRDLGNAGLFADVALKRAINEDSLPGPRLYVSGPGLAPVSGQMNGLDFHHRDLAAKDYRIIRGADDARQAVRENVTFGADLIKVYANASPNPTYLSIEELRAIVEEAHLLNVRVTAHATTDLAIQRALAAGVDSIEHGRGASNASLALMAKQGVYLVPTEWDEFLVRMQLERFPQAPPPQPHRIAELLEPGFERVRRAAAANVPLAAGSDLYVGMAMPRGSAAKHMLFAYAAAGVRPAQVLQMATINAARLMQERRLGAIESGTFADIIAVEGNPLENLSALERVRFVMKDGRIYVERR